MNQGDGETDQALASDELCMLAMESNYRIGSIIEMRVGCPWVARVASQAPFLSLLLRPVYPCQPLFPMRIGLCVAWNSRDVLYIPRDSRPFEVWWDGRRW